MEREKGTRWRGTGRLKLLSGKIRGLNKNHDRKAKKGGEKVETGRRKKHNNEGEKKSKAPNVESVEPLGKDVPGYPSFNERNGYIGLIPERGAVP